MITKLKLKSKVHPSFDEIVKWKGLIVTPLMPNHTDAELCVQIENADYSARCELRLCEDVEEVVDDFDNSVPL